MPARVEPTSILPGLSPVAGKPIVARFDGGRLSSDAGVLALREIERRLAIADRLAACLEDPRTPGRFVTAILRPAKRPAGVEIRAHLRQIRANWPRVEILLHADSHYCGPEVLDWCRTNRLDYVLGLAPTSTLRRHILGLEASTAARFAASPGTAKIRRFKEFYDAAGSWSRTER